MFLPISHQSTQSFTDTHELDYQEVLDFCSDSSSLFFLLLLLFLLNAKRHSTAKCRDSSQAGQEREREKTTHGSAQRREADEEVARRV